MVQLNFNLTLVCTILTCFTMILCVTCELFACHFRRDRNNTPMHENNMGKFSKCEPHHKHKQEPQDVAQHKPYLKVLYNMYALLLMDNSMDNSNIMILSMEPRKWIITLHNNYCLTSYSISCRHTT